jgi:hypothetical protein
LERLAGNNRRRVGEKLGADELGLGAGLGEGRGREE